jgi:hypothetical protein
MIRLAIVIVFMFGLIPDAFAFEEGITPYGDFCPACTRYGICKEDLSHKEAVSAIRSYFMNKHLLIRDVKERGRFIMVDVYRGHTLVDRVLFDRRTGRLRSIY